MSLQKSRGIGVGLRHQHYPFILENWPKADWFEALTENYMDTGGRPLHVLEKIRTRYPVALHGIALSIGSLDPLERNYLNRLKKLADRIDPFVVSDHLCWSGFQGEMLYDLLPLPMTEEAIQHVVNRVDQVQNFLKRKILLENPSSYISFQNSEMPEWEFLREVANRSGCGILLDINNIYVNSVNHQFNPGDYIHNIPDHLIEQIHLAGHTDMGTYLFDTHSAPVIDSVWNLYEKALQKYGPVSTLIEWDAEIPPWERLMEEAGKAKEIYEKYKTMKSVSASPLKTDEAISRRKTLSLPSLSRIQTWLKSEILHKTTSENPESILNPQGKERVHVYTNGYLARIHESLKEVYEAVYMVLNHDRFFELSEAYIEEFPSKNYNLNYVGISFPQLIERSGFRTEFPFLADLSKLEWLIWKAFHAEEKPKLDPRIISEFSPGDWNHLQFEFQPAVSLISSRWSILDLWINRNNPQKSKLNPRERTQYILIGRRVDQVRTELLNSTQFHLLEELLSGKTLGEACERIIDSKEQAEIAVWFSNWMRDGLLTRLSLQKSQNIKASTIR